MWKTRVTQLYVKKKKPFSSLSCQLAAEEAYTTMSCNNSVVLSNRLSRWASKSEKRKNMFSIPAGPEAKESPGFFELMAFFRSPIIFLHCGSVLTVADSRTQKLNSDKFDQWRIRRRMWRNICMYQYRRYFSHKVTTRRFCPQHPTLTPGAGSKTEVGPSIPIYIYIYIVTESQVNT